MLQGLSGAYQRRGPRLHGVLRLMHPERTKAPSHRDAGWNVEWMCREPDISAAGGWKLVDIRRLPGREPSSMVIINKLMPNSPIVTIGDGRPTWMHHATDPPSRTQHRPGFSLHPARSAQTRCIYPASAASTSTSTSTTTSTTSKTVSKRAGGHSGPPLRRGFVSRKGISKTGANAIQLFRIIRRAHRRNQWYAHERDCTFQYLKN